MGGPGGNMGGPEGIWVGRKEYGWAGGNMGGPEGIWVCRREYGWAGGNMVGHEIILSNLGGPLIIFVEMDGL